MAHLLRSAVASAGPEAHSGHTAVAAEGNSLPQGGGEDDEDATADADEGQPSMGDRPAEEVPSWLMLVQLQAGASLLDQMLGQERHWLRRSCWHY